jgi:predicted nucleic acid-binding Zn finger protein
VLKEKDTVDRATVKRVERGWLLYELGHCERHGDLWTVRAQDSSRYYMVALDHDTQGETCECPDYRERGNTCKHIIACTMAEAKS